MFWKFSLLLAAMPLLGLTSQKSVLEPPCISTRSNPKECNGVDPDLFLKNKKTIFSNVEFLLWKVNESILDYAIKMNQPAWSSTVPTFAMGKIKNATFDWDPGVRIAVGYFNALDYWDAFVQYTFLHNDGSNTVDAPGSSDRFLTGTWIHPDFSEAPNAIPLKKAESAIDFYYNTLDGIFSRRFHPNAHFRLNLFGGITSAFIHQSWHVGYTDLLGQHSKIKNSWSFSGVGGRVGIKLDWFMRSNFYLTGQVSNGILSGNYKSSSFQNTDALVPGANNEIPFLNAHYRDFRLTYTAQFYVGPSWQRVFRRMRTEFFAGYEFTIWDNLHELFRFNRASAPAGKNTYINTSLLSLQGLTVRWTLDY